MTNKSSLVRCSWLASSALLGIAIGAALGNGPLLTFRSEGILAMDLSPLEFKRFSELANNADTFRSVVGVTPVGVAQTPAAVREIGNVVTSGKWLKPVPRFSKSDAKDLPNFVDKTDPDKAYLGVALFATATEPGEAAALATWMGQYFKETAAREAIRETVSKWRAENRRFSDFARSEQFRLNFEIEQAQARSKALKTVVSAYPEFSKPEGRQVLEVKKENEKFVSPGQQLVAAETEVIDFREQIVRLQRKGIQEAFAADLLSQAETALKATASGTDSVSKMAAIVKTFRSLAKAEAEQERLVFIEAEISKIGARFLTQPQFVAQPSIATRPESPRPKQVMAVGGLLGAMLMAFWLFRARIRELLIPARE